MIARSLQFFLLALFLGSAALISAAELQTGAVHQLSFRDVDGQDLSTADGHVTIITVVTRDNEDNARAVADHVPERYVGDPKYRYITMVNFQGKLPGPLQGLTRSVIRGRLDSEAKELQPKYDAKQLKRDPRRDVYVVADFDGSAVTKLGLTTDAARLAVFVFDGKGKLVARWSEVPPGDSLGAALAAVE